MSLENSRKLIHDIAAQREADDYIEGLLKEPDMRVEAEATEHQSKWDSLTEDIGTIQQLPESENEREL